MAYKPLYDEAYLKKLISQIQSLNKRKQKHRQSEQRASLPKDMGFSDSAKAALVLLKNIKSKEKGER